MNCRTIYKFNFRHTNEEMTVMSMIFGYCQENALQSCRVYGEIFQNRRLPNHKTFAAVERRFLETGRFAPVSISYDHKVTVRKSRTQRQTNELTIRGERRYC